MSTKISVITPSFNQGRYIEQNICSVLEQNYPNVEHIVVDGGSTDNTLEVLDTYPHLIWRSEKDRGQADALRKGFRQVSGNIIGWINSDDYYEPAIFKRVAECFEDPKIQWVVGNLSYIFDNGQIVRDRSPEISRERLLRQPDIVRQQCTFFRKEFVARAGGWNPDFHWVMDYDLWLRMSALSAPFKLDLNLAYFRMHGDQKTSLDNYLKQGREIETILIREGAPWRVRAALRLKKRWIWLKGRAKYFCMANGLISKKYRSRPVRTRSGKSP